MLIVGLLVNLNHQKLRDVAEVASESHNLKVGGSNPSPATNLKLRSYGEKNANVRTN